MNSDTFFEYCFTNKHLVTEIAKNAYIDNNYAVIKFMVESGINPVNDSNDENILEWFAEDGNLEMVKYLIKSDKINININETSALQSAINNKKYVVAKFLVKSGADLNKLPVSLKIKYYDNINHKPINKLTTDECIILHLPIKENQEYYKCPNKEDHIYSKSAIDSWNNFTCLICMIPLNNEIYVNTE